MARSLPLSDEALQGLPIRPFFLEELPRRVPRGKFYVHGRSYLARNTPAGTLVVFHHHGLIVAHARLQGDWWQPNDDPGGRPTAICVYLFEHVRVPERGVAFADLPASWRRAWKRGHFDMFSRKLDEDGDDEFVNACG